MAAPTAKRKPGLYPGNMSMSISPAQTKQFFDLHSKPTSPFDALQSSLSQYSYGDPKFYNAGAPSASLPSHGSKKSRSAPVSLSQQQRHKTISKPTVNPKPMSSHTIAPLNTTFTADDGAGPAPGGRPHPPMVQRPTPGYSAVRPTPKGNSPADILPIMSQPQRLANGYTQYFNKHGKLALITDRQNKPVTVAQYRQAIGLPPTRVQPGTYNRVSQHPAPPQRSFGGFIHNIGTSGLDMLEGVTGVPGKNGQAGIVGIAGDTIADSSKALYNLGAAAVDRGLGHKKAAQNHLHAAAEQGKRVYGTGKSVVLNAIPFGGEKGIISQYGEAALSALYGLKDEPGYDQAVGLQGSAVKAWHHANKSVGDMAYNDPVGFAVNLIPMGGAIRALAVGRLAKALKAAEAANDVTRVAKIQKAINSLHTVDNLAARTGAVIETGVKKIPGVRPALGTINATRNKITSASLKFSGVRQAYKVSNKITKVLNSPLQNVKSSLKPNAPRVPQPPLGQTGRQAVLKQKDANGAQLYVNENTMKEIGRAFGGGNPPNGLTLFETDLNPEAFKSIYDTLVTGINRNVSRGSGHGLPIIHVKNNASFGEIRAVSSHERLHSMAAQYGLTPRALTQFENRLVSPDGDLHDIYQKARVPLKARGYKDEDIMEEILAQTAGGPHKNSAGYMRDYLGLTDEQKTRVIRSHAQAVIAEHGPDGAWNIYRASSAVPRRAAKAVVLEKDRNYFLNRNRHRDIIAGRWTPVSSVGRSRFGPLVSSLGQSEKDQRR